MERIKLESVKELDQRLNNLKDAGKTRVLIQIENKPDILGEPEIEICFNLVNSNQKLFLNHSHFANYISNTLGQKHKYIIDNEYKIFPEIYINEILKAINYFSANGNS